MKFEKAKAQQARLKMSIYGPPGSGKTFTTLLFAEGLAKHRGKRIAFVDTERGTDFYSQAVPARAAHPEAFDFDAIYTRSLAEILAAVKALDPATHGVVVVDSISHVWESAIGAYEGKMTKIDSIPLQAWGRIKKPYKELVNFLVGSPFDVFILGRQKSVFEGEDGELRKTGVTMKAEGETPYEPHVCARMELRKTGEETVPTMFFEKDRTGVLQSRTFVRPTFATIEPLLPLLGEVQAAGEDDDERQAKDAELLDGQDDKATKKAEKSAGLLAEFTSKLLACTDMAAVGAVAAEVKKSKRYMVEEHTNALRAHYDATVNKIREILAPSTAI